MHHVFGISLPNRVDEKISNKCIVTQKFGRTERAAGQRKYQELNGMVSRSWQRTQCPSINRTGGNHLENMGFHLHLEKWVDSKCNVYCGIQTITPNTQNFFSHPIMVFSGVYGSFCTESVWEVRKWNAKDPEREIVLRDERGAGEENDRSNAEWNGGHQEVRLV